MRTKVSRYTVPELDVFRALCNFTDDESTVFELLARGLSQKQICARSPYAESTVQRLARAIYDKISRVKNYDGTEMGI